MGRILIVDDDPIVREVLSEILMRSIGYKTDIARDGLEGLEKVRHNDYDIIFTDLKMPRLSGIDFLKEAKRLNPSLPVVVITGFATVDNAISAMKEGANDYITKPFRIDSVRAVTDRLTGERDLLRSVATKDDYEASLARLNAELFRKLQEISLIQSVGSELDRIQDNRQVYEKIVEMASRLLKVKEVSFGIIENGHLRMRGAIGTIERDIPVSGGIFEKVVRTKKHCLATFGELNPHNGMLLTSQFLAIPFNLRDEVFGILSLSEKDDETAFTDSEIYLALTFAKKASLRIENNALYDVFYHNLLNTLKSLVMSIEARDSYTKHHSERVTTYALQTAEVMHLSAEDKEAIRFGGYLHDIGKIGVRDTVLLNPGKLSEGEMAEIRLHPVIGDDIVKPIRFFPKERELIRHHHERFDGGGYPDGLAGDQIPLIARILSVADSYDAITSSRPYRAARTHAFAVEELKRCSHTQFDAEVVAAFLRTQSGRGNGNGA